MKNILVLGGTRFFGRELVELLIEEGHRVVIMTRGKSGNPFGDQVEHIIADRSNKHDLAKIAESRTFDIVYDNICFSPNDAYAFCEVFNGKIGKLVFTSTLSTYNADGNAKSEADFDPYTYEIQMGDTADFTYAEGKRQAEAVFFKYAEFPVVAVRLPIVMGANDYTRRLHFHVERVANGEPIGFVNMEAEMSFIQATEAARFLKWAGMTEVAGPYNATANGKIALSDLIKLIEAVTGKTAIITLDSNAENRSPYAIPSSWYMTNENATKSGFQFTQLHDWLKPLIETIAGKNIFQATIEDLDGVSELFNMYRMFYQQPSDLDGAKAYIKSRLENKDSIIFVVKSGQKYVGFTQLYPTFSSISMKRAWILNDLYIDAESRKQGIGEMLLQKAKEFAIETGAKSISLCTAPDNDSAQRLYEKNGYVRDSEFFHYELVLG